MICAIVSVALSESVLAWNTYKCSKVLNYGFLRKYEYIGIGEGNMNATTQGIKKDGSFQTSTQSYSEQTTSSVDPGASTRRFLSTSQFSSSFGDCSLMAQREIREERDHYIAINLDELKKEMALGRGLHLETLASYSLCDVDANQELATQLQKNFRSMVDGDAKEVSNRISDIIRNHVVLQKACDLDRLG